MKYRLTHAAAEDIREIIRHICAVQRSPQNARLVALRLKLQFAKLVEIPCRARFASTYSTFPTPPEPTIMPLPPWVVRLLLPRNFGGSTDGTRYGIASQL